VKPGRRRSTLAGWLAALTAVVSLFHPVYAGRGVEVLRATGGIPAHITGSFREPINFQQAKTGQYFVFDRRGHSVYELDAKLSAAQKIVEIGQEEGRILEPSAFDMEPHGTFVVADGAKGQERIQVFGERGSRLGGFTLPGRSAARITIGTLVLNGVGSLQYTGRSVLINQPETGALVTEYGMAGTPVRSIGTLRTTGHEADRDVHLALNVGVPLLNPQGGFYFVFLAGTPQFQKYNAEGRLLFQRHIEGRELDPTIASLPTSWPRKKGPMGDLPLVTPVVRAAAVDPSGSLWVAFTVPYTYVYDADGEKQRVVQFRGAGVISPTSLFFAGADRLLVTPGCYEFSLK
jgi:hypothetical protein